MLKQILLGSVMATAIATGANALVIDDFSTPLTGNFPGGAIVLVGAGAYNDFSAGAGILGGDREVRVTNAGPGTNVVTANANGGSFQHNNGSGAGTSLLRWDGAGGSTTGLDFGLAANLGQGGNVVHISVLDADLTGSFVTLRLYTDAGNWSAGNVALPAGPSEHYLPLAAIAGNLTGNCGDLDPNTNCGVDLTNVGAIELFAQGSSSFDVSIDIIETVPEPASLGLLGAGIMGMGYFGKRRKA